jgi:eukaryotic-like serine/threonine-protein kinase
VALQVGTRLGPYDIQSALGAGGMGEVYRALDTRLNRTVAIKVLATRLTTDRESRERFEREARIIAALEHPHICPLYDVGTQNGVDFLVMQYLEGESLAERLARGVLPLDQALRYSIELARALDVAHRAGVIHRDVKPANIMITKSGVKLLDFGVARAVASRTEEVDARIATASTVPGPLTQEGTLLGTLQYMAPEQLEGTRADARTDIFAFGAVLYEMTTGRKAFNGANQAELIAAIVSSDPAAISTLRVAVPRLLDRAIQKCLAKDPDVRWQSAGDLGDTLNWALDSHPNIPDVARPAMRSLLRDTRVWLAVIAVGTTAASAAWLLRPSPPATLSTARFVIEPPRNMQVGSPSFPTTLAFSPDGRNLVYVASRGGERQLFVRAIDQLESKTIDGTAGAYLPFFSPDGRWIGFLSDTSLSKIPLSGGASVAIASAPRGPGANWGADDQIVFVPSTRSGLSLIPANGGSSRPLTRLDAQRGDTSHRWPELLPGGRAVIFTAGPPVLGDWYDGDIMAQSVDTGERHVLIRGAAQARYVATGHLVYARAGTLFAVPFDADGLRVTGPAVAVLHGVREDQASAASQFTISAAGSLAYVPGGLTTTEIRWVDRHGRTAPLMSHKEPRKFYHPRLSPDGQRLAITAARGNDDIWVYDLAQEALSRFTSGANHSNATWSPDGKRIMFTLEEANQLVWQLADRNAPEETMAVEPGFQLHGWSPDGQLVIFTKAGQTTGTDIWALRLADRERRPIIQTRFEERAPAISPDGRWLAYASNESGRFEVYVQPWSTRGGKVPISRAGGSEPLWNPNGNELFFRQENKLMAAAVTGSLRFGTPQELFEMPAWNADAFRANYDVARDGQRFVLMTTPNQDATSIHVVLNWLQELKRLVPTK